MLTSDCLGINESGHLTIGGVDTTYLAEKYGTSPTNVERNIRYIIESTWERSKKSTRSDKVDTMFGGIVKKPTNSEFILTCSEWLRYGDR